LYQFTSIIYLKQKHSSFELNAIKYTKRSNCFTLYKSKIKGEGGAIVITYKAPAHTKLFE